MLHIRIHPMGNHWRGSARVCVFMFAVNHRASSPTIFLSQTLQEHSGRIAADTCVGKKIPSHFRSYFSLTVTACSSPNRRNTWSPARVSSSLASRTLCQRKTILLNAECSTALCSAVSPEDMWRHLKLSRVVLLLRSSKIVFSYYTTSE